MKKKTGMRMKKDPSPKELANRDSRPVTYVPVNKRAGDMKNNMMKKKSK